MSQNMTRSDAELVYEMLNDAARGDVEADAYSRTLDAWSDDRPDDLDALEAAHDNDSSSFSWENVDFQFENRGRDRGDELVPMTGVEPRDEEDTHDLAWDFAADYLKAVVAEIRRMQESTDYSARQFVALVAEAADNIPEEVAASKMDISVGNYRGKLGDVKQKHETAEETVSVTKRIRA